jgi:osmotically-inducible protein OsmY
MGYGEGMPEYGSDPGSYEEGWRSAGYGARNRGADLYGGRQQQGWGQGENRSQGRSQYGEQRRPYYSGRGSSSMYYNDDDRSYPSSERGYMSGRERQDDRGWWDKTSDEVASWFGDEGAERRREMDSRRSGDYRGRGPKGYTRSDDRITEDVNDRLTDYSYLDASDIEVSVDNGNVVLTGTVEGRYEKRLAEDLAEQVSGVKNVENRLRVENSEGKFSTGRHYTGSSEFETSQSKGTAA